MADGDGERVGRVVGTRLLGQAEQRLDHARHLVLRRAAAAAHRALDLLGGVAGTADGLLAGGEHRHAAGLPDRERGPHVLAEVELLERHRVGLVLAQQILERAVDLGQAPLVRCPGARLDDAAVERDQPAVAARDDAVARVGETRVYAEDDHGL